MSEEASDLQFSWKRLADGSLRVRLYGFCVGGVRQVENSSPPMWYGWVNSLDRDMENVTVCYSEDGAKDDVAKRVKALAGPKYRTKKYFDTRSDGGMVGHHFLTPGGHDVQDQDPPPPDP